MRKIALPLPIYTSEPVGSVQAKDGTEFSACIGLTENLVQQLKERSLDATDTELQKNTSDLKRFGEGSYETWYAKDRTPFALIDTHGILAALIWLGPQAFPQTVDFHSDNIWATVAFRAYEPFRGRGLMRPFSVLALDMYKKLRPHHRVWLETNTDNEAGKHLYHKLGFEEIGVDSNTGRLVMAMSS